ncbi:penicillin-binding protein [Chitinophaga alhagiae]|uniref:Penicillin-binding protein n=1 Tax=Chitinophaga alhagiae TaxID=2203219 RepID=A0ABM6WA59_9BACT|nr:serine hydrolase [Chitinophaga alhagiae]AWO00767.1 penicillin-binding protein [Chitinophaga alhagiae]
MKLIPFIGLALLAFTQAKAQQSDSLADKRLAGIDSLLSTLLADCKAAGFAVAVVKKDKIVYAKGFGYRNYAQKLPVTPNTLFAIGSSTKAFTCALLGQLAHEGKLELDKPALTYLPGYHFYNEKMDANITIRDMMSHRTGLPRHDWSWYAFKTGSRDSLMKRLQYLEPNRGVREYWQYNNLMYMAQGVIAEKLTGKPWEDNIRERILTPLGMTRTNFSVEDMQQDKDFAYGYTVKKDSVIEKMDFHDLSIIGPAGSINSSANEIAAWLITWINEGKYKGKDVLAPSYIEAAAAPQMVIPGAALPKKHSDIHLLSYGLGWFVSSYRGHYEVEHGGNIDGFSASVAFYPSDELGIVVLSNQNGSSVPDYARKLIADRMLQLKYVDWNAEVRDNIKKAIANRKTASKTKNADRIKGTRPSHQLSAYEGSFYNPGYGTISITQHKNALYLKIGPKDSLYLSHFHYDVFEAKGIDDKGVVDSTGTGLRFTFRYNDTGRVEKLLAPLESSLKSPIEFTYQPKQLAVPKSMLEKYTGEYLMGKASVRVYTKGDVLYVFVPGQPEYETSPTGEHTFTLTKLNGYKVRFGLKGQEVESITFLQPNGTFEAKKKK